MLNAIALITYCCHMWHRSKSSTVLYIAQRVRFELFSAFEFYMMLVLSYFFVVVISVSLGCLSDAASQFPVIRPCSTICHCKLLLMLLLLVCTVLLN